MTKGETVVHNGIKYRRYPTSPHQGSHYFRSGKAQGDKLLHRVIWEEHHGPIPDGHLVHHIDDDPGNNEITNLECVTRSAHQGENHPRWPPGPEGEKPLKRWERRALHPDAEKFREYLGFDCAPSTAYNYSRDVNKFLMWVDKPLDELTPMDITDWYKSLEEAYAPRTIWRLGWALRRFFDVMGMQEMKMRTPIVTYDVPEPKWLTREQTMELIGDVPVLCVSYDLALRVGEVRYLTRSKFNPDTGDIEVRRLKHKGRRNTYILRLDGWCLDILNEHLGPEGLEEIMFPMIVPTIQKLFNERAQSLGLEGYTFHSLRHSRVTHIAIKELEEKGVVDELSLSKFAGHLRVETTRMYVHLASRHLAFKS